MKKLSVIIVNYNVCYFLEQALKSVINAVDGIDAEIFVVDNNSVDGSVKMVKEKFPDVILIDNEDNVGFSKANNQAMRIAQGEYILLLNPDTIVEEDTLSKCCDFMDAHPNAGGLGVKMVDGAGNFLPESKRGLPTPSVAFYKISGLSSIFPKSKRFGSYHLGYLDNDETHEVDILAGAYMFMRKEALEKVGLLDEDYFMYGEDIDLSYRLVKGGYKNYYFADTRIIHYKGESTKKTSVNYVFVFYGAMIIFAKKHFSKGKAGMFEFLISMAIYAKATMSVIKTFLKKSLPTLVDFSLIMTVLYFLKEYWEKSFKPTPNEFTPEYIWAVVPTYVVVWLLSNHLSGGNDKPYNIYKILRGIVIGTLLISAGSNFLDDFRYSKGMIVIGGASVFLVLCFTRLVRHFMRYRNFKLHKSFEKRVALVGNKQESQRVAKLLEELNISVDYVGYITPNPPIAPTQEHLGRLRQLNEIVEIHKVNELIFCSKDVPANQLIEYMIKTPNVDFKTVPDSSDYIIGSNSKNRPGDYYTLELKLNLSKDNYRRNKRAFDILTSFASMLMLPVLILFVSKKLGFVKNILKVAFGKKTWVGFSGVANSKLPSIRKGVLRTYHLNKDVPDATTMKQLDLMYAKDYHVFQDAEIWFRSISRLGD